MRSLTKNLRKVRRLTLVSSDALQNSYDVLQKNHKDLEVRFDALWSSTFKPSNNNEAFTSQISMKTCDEEVA
jgi:hypothetical protein